MIEQMDLVEDKSLEDLEMLPNFSALTTPAPKTDQPAIVEGENVQITVLAPKTSVKAKLKRIASTNDQLTLVKKPSV